METSPVKKNNVLVSIVCALFLLTMAVCTSTAVADTVNQQTIKGTQVAWWGGGGYYGGGYYRPYRHHYYRPVYWGGPRYYHRACARHCRSTRWGVRCWRRC